MKLDFPNSVYAKAILACAIVQAILVIILEAIVTQQFLVNTAHDDLQDTPAKGVPIYLVIFILAQLMSVYLCVDALFNKNVIQLWGFVAFNIGVFAYSLFQYFQIVLIFDTAYVINPDALNIVRPLLYVIPIIIAIFCVVYGYMAWKLYQEFGWKIYKKIGANPKMRNMYRTYQILLMLIKFAFFFALGFLIQFLTLQLNTTDPEFWITIVAIPVAIACFILAVYGVRKENKAIVIVFMILLLLVVAYFIFKIVRINSPALDSKYQYTRKFLTFFAVLALLCFAALFVVTVLCYRNFDLGLKNHLLGTAAPKPAIPSRYPPMRPAGAVPVAAEDSIPMTSAGNANAV